MRYSYINPRKKTIFTKEIQLLFIFFSVTLFMLFSTYAFLIFQDNRFTQEMTDIKSQKNEYRTNIPKMENQIAAIEKQISLSEKIFTKNIVLRDSINNLFDLVPNRITLTEAKIMENALILYGITPNKDVYNFMLQAPLRSIFHRTYSSFYPADNGWLRFVSTNYIDNEEELSNEN
ncbi:MAG: hypothetical protein PHQ93_04595 [Sulfurimonas sp.]|uniref:hypothetical protein n=1 Tax=Sulfurimonas sp. TaxID=2022749 RepID=UPI002630AE01|nr:hypothetical protein [Sulfurimonas sp.]MDD5400447.1 hypothetical protein [Sulfurimonas sp.]